MSRCSQQWDQIHRRWVSRNAKFVQHWSQADNSEESHCKFSCQTNPFDSWGSVVCKNCWGQLHRLSWLPPSDCSSCNQGSHAFQLCILTFSTCIRSGHVLLSTDLYRLVGTQDKTPETVHGKQWEREQETIGAHIQGEWPSAYPKETLWDRQGGKDFIAHIQQRSLQDLGSIQQWNS